MAATALSHWRGVGPRDQTGARQPLAWSGFRASARRTPTAQAMASSTPSLTPVTAGSVTIGEVIGAGHAAAAVIASLRAATLTSSAPDVIFDTLDELVSQDAGGLARRGQADSLTEG